MARMLRNLIPNPSFETNLTGWAANSPAVTLARETNASYGAPAGAYYAYTRITTSTQDLFISQTVNSPVTAGKTYHGSAYIQRDGAGQVDATIDWYNSSGTRIGNSGVATTPSVPSSKWRRVVCSGVAPAGAIGGRLIVAFRSQAVNNFVRFDAAMLYEVLDETAPGTYLEAYGDGSMPGWAWDGTAHASASVQLDAQYTSWPYTGNPACSYYTGAEVDGLEFDVLRTCRLRGLRYFRVSTSVAGATGRLYIAQSASAGTVVPNTDVTFSLGTTTGWKDALFSTPVELIPGNRYKAVVAHSSGRVASNDSSHYADGSTGGTGQPTGPLRIPPPSEAFGNTASSAASGGTLTYPTLNSGHWYGIDMLVDQPYQDARASFF